MNKLSRYNYQREIDEMDAFDLALTSLGLANHVSELFYDSKCGMCNVKTTSTDYPPQIWSIAEQHLAQFCIGGYVGHAVWLDDELEGSSAEGEEISSSTDSVQVSDYCNECLGRGVDLAGDVCSFCSGRGIVKVDVDLAARAEDLLQSYEESSALEDVESVLNSQPDIKARGDFGELKLAEWFGRSGLPYLAIDQERHSFFRDFSGTLKRPDFLLLINSIGLVAIDAKNLEKFDGGFTFSLRGEILRALNFEQSFRLPLWYAVLCDEQWYWISLQKVVGVGRVRRNRHNKQPFLYVGIEHFAKVYLAKDLGQIIGLQVQDYSHVENLLRAVRRAPRAWMR